MRKYLLSLVTVISLYGCSGFPGVYKIDIPQGNIVTQEMLDQLKPGMTHNQVRYVMGTPLVTDTFSNNRWDYIYTMQSADGTRSEQRVYVLFEQGKLTGVETFNQSSTPSQQSAATANAENENSQ